MCVCVLARASVRAYVRVRMCELVDSQRRTQKLACRKETQCSTYQCKVPQKSSVAVPTCLEHFLSHSFRINLAPSMGESSPKENDSELWDRNRSQKSGVSRLRVSIG